MKQTASSISPAAMHTPIMPQQGGTYH